MSKTTHWYWVRHGPTNFKNIYGWTDVPADLSDQAALNWLDNELPETAAVVSSDLTRCVKTADAICHRRGRLPDTRSIREINFGDWEGKSPEEINTNYPELAHQFWNCPGTVSPPNGESWSRLHKRVNSFVNKLTESNPHVEHIVAVSHYGVILTQVQRALEISNAETMKLYVASLSITSISSIEGSWKLNYLNRLPDQLDRQTM